MRDQAIGWVRSQVAEIEQMLREMEPWRRSQRAGFEARLVELRAELATAEAMPAAAAVDVMFSGPDVDDREGITTRFASEALARLSDLIDALNTDEEAVAKARGQKIVRRRSMLTDLPAGSFGFRIESGSATSGRDAAGDEGRVTSPIPEVADIFESMAGGDQELGDYLAAATPTVREYISKLMELLRRRGASVHVRAEDTDSELSVERVSAIAQQLKATVDTTREEVGGTLRAVTIKSKHRRFEAQLSDGTSWVRGLVNSSIAEPDLLKLQEACMRPGRLVLRKSVSKTQRRVVTSYVLDGFATNDGQISVRAPRL